MADKPAKTYDRQPARADWESVAADVRRAIEKVRDGRK